MPIFTFLTKIAQLSLVIHGTLTILMWIVELLLIFTYFPTPPPLPPPPPQLTYPTIIAPVFVLLWQSFTDHREEVFVLESTTTRRPNHVHNRVVEICNPHYCTWSSSVIAVPPQSSRLRPIFRAVPVVVSFPVGYAKAHVPIQKMLFNWTTGESSLIRED